MLTKTCGNCVNCEKYTHDNGERWWVCENWSDDPADKNKPQDALRYFVDHYYCGDCGQALDWEK